MPAPKSSSAKSRSAAKPKAAASRAAAKPKSTTAAKSTASKATRAKSTPAKSSPAKSTGAKSTPAKSTTAKSRASTAAARKSAARNVNNPIDLVILTRDRIQDTLDEAAKRGRVTRSDANDLVAELVRRGQRQSEDLVAEFERQLGRAGSQIESATRKARRAEPVDRIVRTADRARRTARVGPAFPILGYDDLTAGQVTARLGELKSAELRKVRDYERKHANRKSVLEAVEKALA